MSSRGDPDRSVPMIADAQVHLWARPTPHRPWADQAASYIEHAPTLSSGTRPPLGAGELIGEMYVAGVDRVLLVPPVFAGDDNAASLEAVDAHPDRFAVMGRISLAPIIHRWRDEALGALSVGLLVVAGGVVSR